ncbi:MAG: DUF1566 domain-containing protein [Desulfatibacillum sp.]|nr:DUF1566 domain-containing protein [Desulfatibacillum sp.]
MHAVKTRWLPFVLARFRWLNPGLSSIKISLTVFLTVLSILVAVTAAPALAAATGQPAFDSKMAGETMGRLPMTFEPNEGQAESNVRYVARCPGATLYFYDNAVDFLVTRQGSTQQSISPDSGAAVSVKPERIRMRIVGARPFPQIEAIGALPGKVNYFKGPDPAKWRTGIPTYRKVKYVSVYPGIDLVFYGNPRMLEYDFIVRPGANPSQIRIAFDGAEAGGVSDDGALVMSTPCGARVLQHRPVVYQKTDSLRETVEGGYRALGSGLYGFNVAAYDAERTLVIDPGFQFSSYIGGTDEESVNAEGVGGIAVGADGGVYIGGTTTATDFPAVSQIPNAANDSSLSVEQDAWAAKVHRSGAFLEWSTILGGWGVDTITSLALDSKGNVIVVGRGSTLFPEVRPLYTKGGMFVAQIKGDGSALLFSTRFGGSSDGTVSGVAVDSNDYVYITGQTYAEDFPVTANAYQGQLIIDNPQFATDAFVMKIDPTAGMLHYSTYMGGTKDDWGRGIAVDSAGCAYMAGETSSTDYPVVNPYQGAHAGGSYDGVVTKFNPEGSGLVYSTYLGSNDGGAGSAAERCQGIALDSNGRAYVTGITSSETFPTASPVQGVYGGNVDAFVAEFSADGSELVFSTYLGGSEMERGYAIAVDPQGYICVGGHTKSSNDSDIGFPLVNPAQPDFARGLEDPGDWWDGFVTVYTPGGSALYFSTYLGGNNWDTVSTVAMDANGAIYAAGQTTSQTFPVIGGIDFPNGSFPKQNSLQGTYDGFVTKFGSIYTAYLIFSDLELTGEENADPVKVGEALIHTLTVENKGPDTAANTTLQGELSGVFDSVVLSPSVGSCTGGASFHCELGDLDPSTTATVTLTAVPARIGAAGLEAFAYSDSGDTNTDNNFVSEETDLTPASDLIPDPTFAAFTATEAGGRSPLQTFLITNSTDGNRTVGQIDFAGKNAAEFLIDSDTCSGTTLAPGAQCSVDVAMTPVSSGDKEALLTIPSNDSAFPVVEVPLSGNAYTLGLPAVVLRKTGQKTSYATGDDGDLQMGADWPEPRFVDNGDGTVTDLLTGLMWLKHSTCTAVIGFGTFYWGEVTWQQALDFVTGINDGTYDISGCAGYNGDYADWRLPNANEMRSLYSGDLTITGTALLETWGFVAHGSPIGGEQFWWSSTSVPDPMFLGALRGSARFYPFYYAGKTSTSAYTQAWPVRDAGITAVAAVARTGQTKCYDNANNEIDCLGTGQDGAWNKGVAWPSPRFLDHGDGTVTDLMTHLMWTKNASVESASWEIALSNMETRNGTAYLGHSDWRLPNVEEMASLLDYSNKDPVLPADHPFTNVVREYWTSTAYSETDCFQLYLRWGYSQKKNKGNSYAIWPVRGGSKPYYLVDAITVLKVLSQKEAPMASRIKDINGNGKIDLAEAIYIMQTLYELR